MPVLYVDNQPYPFEGEHKSLLEVCLSLGFNIPYFCWHPAMHSVGACRQCAVKQFRDEKDTRGRIVMSCMTPASDGTRISIDDPEVRAFRASVIEWLMINHPHDCPVCDEGGECHLQDMTVLTGHAYRRYRFSKRTHRNQELGPFINHEMNRCIQCYRCLRFYRDYAGGRDFGVFGWHDHIYFGRHSDGVLESGFSGNLVEICPTGVFTDKTFKKHFARKWDLQTAPSICVHCGLGCNTIPGERYGTLRRILNRYNWNVNGYFLCDRGRFGYEFVNGERRIRRPLTRSADGTPVPATTEELFKALVSSIRSPDVVGIGSPRASLEANFALRSLVGKERFCSGIPRIQHTLMHRILAILRGGPAPAASLQEARVSDAVLVLGEDVYNSAPLLALALRQAAIQKPLNEARSARLGIPAWEDAALREAIQQREGPVYLATPDRSALDSLATGTLRAAPADIARLGFAVAHAIDPQAPAVPQASEQSLALAGQIAAALKQAQRPLVVSGTTCGSEALLQSAANVAWALARTGRPARICFVVPECNSLGVALLDGSPVEEAVEYRRKHPGAMVVVLENDVFRRLPEDAAEELFGGGGKVLAIDHLATPSASRADWVLPAATFAEGHGTLVNNEARAQRYYSVMPPAGAVQESWRWLGKLAALRTGLERAPWPTLEDLRSTLAAEVEACREILVVDPPAGLPPGAQKIPRQSQRYSGRTAVTANLDVHEPRPPEDPDSPFSYSMEGFAGRPPSSLVPRYWRPGWNSVQSLNKFQSEVGGPLSGVDPGRRLVEPAGGSEGYYEAPGEPFRPDRGKWLFLSACHIFGSEELSLLSRGIAELTPKPYVALDSHGAAELGIQEGQAAQLEIGTARFRLPLHIHRELPRGVAVLPVGIPGVPSLLLPAWGAIAGVGSGRDGGESDTGKGEAQP
jgi:NADH-quinone oxidoreductase subunit G